MFFYLSKVFWFLADPGNLILIAIFLVAFFAWMKWFNILKILITFTAISAAIVTFLPIGTLIINHLENRFPEARSFPADIEGIIVLGGVVDPHLTKNRNQISINSAAERITEFARLSNIYPQAKLVYSGGSGDPERQGLKEADFIFPLLEALNINLERVIFENQSRNTIENATFTKKLVSPSLNQHWIIITSAFHMPRAVATFRQYKWNVLAYPVDYRTPYEIKFKLSLNFISSLSLFSLAIHECIGLIFYWLSGHTNELYPKPNP
jgi:uncharacterized SAM-binding protein YcdF (DUF218 family)